MRLFNWSSSPTSLLEFHSLLSLLCLFIFNPTGSSALSVTVGDADSYRNAASTAAYDMMTYYTGNQTGQIPGKLLNTWWEGGALFMTLIEYWHWTGDDSYNAETIQGMQWQAGNADYMPNNYSNYLV
jgi:mannan endo-1,6-alpha-mannosidase